MARGRRSKARANDNASPPVKVQTAASSAPRHPTHGPGSVTNSQSVSSAWTFGSSQDGYRVREPGSDYFLFMMSVTAFPQYSRLSFEEMRYNHYYYVPPVSEEEPGTSVRTTPALTNPTVSASTPFIVMEVLPTPSPMNASSPTPSKGGPPVTVTKEWLSPRPAVVSDGSLQPVNRGNLNPRAPKPGPHFDDVFDRVAMANKAGILEIFQSVSMVSKHKHLSFEEMRMHNYRSTNRFSPPTFGAPTPAYAIVPFYEGTIPGYELWAKVTEDRDPEDVAAAENALDGHAIPQNGASEVSQGIEGSPGQGHETEELPEPKIERQVDTEFVERLRRLEEIMERMMRLSTSTEDVSSVSFEFHDNETP